MGVLFQSVGEKQWRYVIKYNKLDASKIDEVALS